jgi:hypothetical protein
VILKWRGARCQCSFRSRRGSKRGLTLRIWIIFALVVELNLKIAGTAIWGDKTLSPCRPLAKLRAELDADTPCQEWPYSLDPRPARVWTDGNQLKTHKARCRHQNWRSRLWVKSCDCAGGIATQLQDVNLGEGPGNHL